MKNYYDIFIRVQSLLLYLCEAHDSKILDSQVSSKHDQLQYDIASIAYSISFLLVFFLGSLHAFSIDSIGNYQRVYTPLCIMNMWLFVYFADLVVNYGISKTRVLEIQ